jgi:N utilization substance protein B
MSPAGPGKSFEARSRSRRRALQALYQWQITGQEADEVLGQFRAVQDLSGVDEVHFERLVRGVIAQQPELDGALQPFLDRPIDQVDLMERVILRLGSFELLHCPDLPFRVVLDESVDLARRFGATQGHTYVNAVLDKAARRWREAEVSLPDEPGPPA